MKICPRCKQEKEFDNFAKDNKSLNKLKNRCKDCDKKYYLSRKENLKEKNHNYYLLNKEKICLNSRNYQKGKKIDRRSYRKNKRMKDINFRIACNLRNRLYQAVIGNFKSGSAVRDLGCTIEELKFWLEQKFKEGMTWGNYGKWHIDHIIPLADFDLTNRQKLLEACHYTNLQPLWAEENLRKNDKILIDASQ